MRFVKLSSYSSFFCRKLKVIHSKFLRDEIDGERLHPDSTDMTLLRTGKNNRNKKGYFDGGDLQDLLRFVDEKGFFAFKTSRGKTSYHRTKFKQRFIDPEFKKKAMFDKYLAIANHFDDKPLCVQELRHHFQTANATSLLEWNINSINVPLIWNLADHDLLKLFKLLHAGKLLSQGDIHTHAYNVMGRIQLMVS